MSWTARADQRKYFTVIRNEVPRRPRKAGQVPLEDHDDEELEPVTPPPKAHNRKAGGAETPAKTRAPPRAKSEVRKPPKEAGARAPLFGTKLAKEEALQALKAAPLTENGKQRLFSDNSCHRGCTLPAGKCAHSHELITAVKDLHWALQSEFLRRGGLKNGKKIEAADADKRISQLCDQAKRDKAGQEPVEVKGAPEADKQKWQRARPGASAKAAPVEKASGSIAAPAPDDYEFFEMEERERVLADLHKGPDTSWLENQKAPLQLVSPPGDYEDGVYSTRLRKWENLTKAGFSRK